MIKGINNKDNENEDHVSDRIWGDLLLLQQFSLKLNYILVNKNKEKNCFRSLKKNIGPNYHSSGQVLIDVIVRKFLEMELFLIG